MDVLGPCFSVGKAVVGAVPGINPPGASRPVPMGEAKGEHGHELWCQPLGKKQVSALRRIPEPIISFGKNLPNTSGRTARASWQIAKAFGQFA